MTDKHFCAWPDCVIDDCPTLEEAHKEMRGEMIREGLPKELIAFQQMNTSIILLTNIDALRYERMKDMHIRAEG